MEAIENSTMPPYIKFKFKYKSLTKLAKNLHARHVSL